MDENEELKQRILEYPGLICNNRVNPRKFHQLKKTKLYIGILEATDFLIVSVSITQRLWHIVNQIYHIKTCKTCNNITKFTYFHKGYNNFCSQKCSSKSKAVSDKNKQTKLERYGDPNYNNSKQSMESKHKFTQKKIENITAKRKKTCLKKYGVEYASQSDECKEKTKITNLEKYGVDSFSKTSEFKEKTIKTNLERYGVEYYSSTNEYKFRKKTTCMEKYGVDSFSKTSEFKEKTIKTNLERYGVEWSFQSDNNKVKSKQTKLERYNDENYNNRNKAEKTCLERYNTTNPAKTTDCKKKIKETCLRKYGVESFSKTSIFLKKFKDANLERYGVEHYNQKHISKETLEKLNSKGWLTEQHHNLKKSQSQIANNLNIDNTTLYKYLNIYDIEIKYYSYSFKEKLLAEYIQKKYDTKIITNTRTIIKPYEIDIYIPEYNLAIEYNGVYWHNPSRYESKEDWFKYHQNKIDMCDTKGIELLHLWENYGNHNVLIEKAINSNVSNDLTEIYENIYKKAK